MKYENEHGVPTITFTDNVFVELRNDWLQLTYYLRRGEEYNWYDISIALLEFHIERDQVIAGWDVDIRLLGFGARLRWNTTPNEKTKQIMEDVKNATMTLETRDMLKEFEKDA